MKAMIKRKMAVEQTLLDLIAGMTRADPADRYTIPDIKNHQWLQEDTATPEEMNAHFYFVTGKANEEAAANHALNQAAKAGYVKAHAVNRSHGGAGMSQEDFIAFTEEWEDLRYYNI